MDAHELLIAGLLVGGSRDLLDAWAHDPYVRVGPVALALWGLTVWSARRAGGRAADPDRITAWRFGAVVLFVLGRILEVHMLAHLALATWLSAGAPRRQAFLLLASASWIPVLGHRLFPLAPTACNAFRFGWAIAALAFVMHAGRPGRGGP